MILSSFFCSNIALRGLRILLLDSIANLSDFSESLITGINVAIITVSYAILFWPLIGCLYLKNFKNQPISLFYSVSAHIFCLVCAFILWWLSHNQTLFFPPTSRSWQPSPWYLWFPIVEFEFCCPACLETLLAKGQRPRGLHLVAIDSYNAGNGLQKSVSSDGSSSDQDGDKDSDGV
jgi:hypothetical protein